MKYVLILIVLFIYGCNDKRRSLNIYSISSIEYTSKRYDPNISWSSFIAKHKFPKKKFVRIGVIDINFNIINNLFKVCDDFKYSSKIDYINDNFPPHGQIVLKRITKEIKSNNYCIYPVLLRTPGARNHIKSLVTAYELLLEKKVDIINNSFGGYSPSFQEKRIISKLHSKKVIMVFCSGNITVDLSEYPYYPASYYNKNIVVGTKIGENIYGGYGKKVDYYGDAAGGTSYSTASVTGKIVNYMLGGKHE